MVKIMKFQKEDHLKLSFLGGTNNIESLILRNTQIAQPLTSEYERKAAPMKESRN